MRIGKLVVCDDEVYGTYMYTSGQDTCIFFDKGDWITESIFMEITHIRTLHTFLISFRVVYAGD